MAEIIVAQRMWQRKDTAAAWEAKNPILAAGEIGVEVGATSADEQTFKIGNGTSPWNELAYAGGGIEIEFRKTDTHLQWRQVGDPDWTDLVALADITGHAGVSARNTVALPNGLASVVIARLATLVSIQCTAPARVRLYCTAAARSADAGRATGTLPAQGAGCLLEFIATPALLAAPLTPGVFVYNLDTPATNTIYTNVEGGSATATLAFNALESI